MVRAKKTQMVPSPWEQQLAESIADTAIMLQGMGGSSTYVSLNGGMFTFNEAQLPTPLNVVIVASSRLNVHYAGAYDSDNPTPPICFALTDRKLPPAEREAAMRPHETAPEPQAYTCKECELNKYGSGARDRGKACANKVKLAMLSAEALESPGVQDAPPALLLVPVTSGKIYKRYVDELANVLKRPTFGVVTAIDIIPDTKTQFKLVFKAVGNVNPKTGMQIVARREEMYKLLNEPPVLFTDDDQLTAAPKKKAATKKKAADKKKGARF